jgi:hypothetical protein
MAQHLPKICKALGLIPSTKKKKKKKKMPKVGSHFSSQSSIWRLTGPRVTRDGNMGVVVASHSPDALASFFLLPGPPWISHLEAFVF